MEITIEQIRDAHEAIGVTGTVIVPVGHVRITITFWTPGQEQVDCVMKTVGKPNDDLRSSWIPSGLKLFVTHGKKRP